MPAASSFPHALPSLLLTGCLGLSACTGIGQSKNPGAEVVAAGWIDDATVGAPAAAEPERLALLAQAGLEGRILRLDRLLDLYDGARFAGDKDARDSLWQALGPYSSSRGIDASREVVLRLLEEAYALEDLAASTEAATPGSVDEEDQRFIADAIMLLSADMFLPDSAEALITQTLAYRVLTETGHPRVADNAQWRIYDHVRGVLVEAVEIGPELRDEVAVHALYTVREDLSPWLEDLAPHAQPPLPSPAQLWALLEAPREALAQTPRWQAVVASRSEEETQLRETVLALLPQPRDPSWTLPELPRGTGHRESLAPVVLLRPGEVVLDPGGEAAQTFTVGMGGPDPLRAGIEGLLARDGRGTLLVAAHPELPAPEYADALAAMVEVRAATLEFAVHEPRLEGVSEDGSEVGAATLALPMLVARANDLNPGARALRGARIHVQLSGRGPRVRVDGEWLGAAPGLPSDVKNLAQTLHHAFPRERAVSLSIAPGVQHRQLIDLLAVLTGGVDSPFLAVGWLPDEAIVAQAELPAGGSELATDATLAKRAALTRRALQSRLVFPALELSPGAKATPVATPVLAPDGEARMKVAAEALFACMPELEAPLPKDGLSLELRFEKGRFTSASADAGRRLGRSHKEQLGAVEACARERLIGLSVPLNPELPTAEVPASLDVTVIFTGV